MKGWLVALCLAASVADAGVAAQVAAQLQHPAVLRGSFVQEQQVEGFKKPLVSSGHFLLVRDKGILWDTDKPFASRMSITRARMLGTREDGSVLLNLGQGQAPLGAIHEILFAVLAGDVAVLKQHFVISGTAGPPWQLVLAAKDGDPVARALRQVTLQGGTSVQRIGLTEANGDRRSIVLHNAAAEPLRAEESQRFE